jgi:hypothetical protein
MKDKELKREEIEASHTRWSRGMSCTSRGEGSEEHVDDIMLLCCQTHLVLREYMILHTIYPVHLTMVRACTLNTH